MLASHNIFIVAHPRCGDALGATLAMAQWLAHEGKQYTAFSAREAPPTLWFLPGIEDVVIDQDVFDLANYDALVILDSGDVHMTGIEEKIRKEVDQKKTTIINIDHHYTNSGFGDIAFIDKKAPSTTWILYDFFEVNKIPLTRDMATCLLSGILYDTGMFSNAATSEQALSTASRLLSRGVPMNFVMEGLVNNKTIGVLNLWGVVLSRLHHHKQWDIVYTFLVPDDFQPLASSPEHTEDLANFLNNIAEGKFSMLLKEDRKGLVKVSLRTTRDDVDVGEFAGFFGGGGHRKSAGFAVPGSLIYNEQEGRVYII